ncbi:S8 family serine peptidase [Saccharothrix variisporea]|uniref:Subtilase family protein n=1 Tax=Saccharothrix variisporea TaxID=543527 RepID=A0A495XN48_9PSEU|nr:S8 family serine peptidase [Saccharothrix variisporea]RKT74326.1 subtilase family protein [Saccharothrix variisporea]
MEPRRDTVLDARLRGAAAFAESDLPVEESIGARTLGRETAPRRTTVKLLVRSAELAAAEEWLEAAGGSVVSAPPDPGSSGQVVVLAGVPVAALSDLDGQPWLLRAEAPKEMFTRMDRARGPVTGLDTVQAAHTDLTGAGVLLAVVDTGIDWTHPDFRHDDGTTRLERFVHAHVPEGTEESKFDVFDAGAINKALNGGPAIPTGDPGGHGTHCASIAAGNGRGTADHRFRGVAPEASLMGVRAEPLLDVHIIEGIRQAFDLAGDRPAVVSLSLGGHFGAHDGTSAIENEIARATGPGRIVVVAAGNEGDDGVHAQGRLVVGEELTFTVRVPDTGLVFCDVWIPRGDEVDVFVETPSGTRFEPNTGEQTTPDGTFVADFVENPVNREQNLTFLMINGTVDDRWTIRVTPLSVVHGEVHAWAGSVDGGRLMFPGAPLEGYSLGMPATEERAIAVGSLISRNKFEGPQGDATLPGLSVDTLSTFSSQGPTRSGAQKPDIVAPGQVVTAALSAGSELATEPRLAARQHPSGKYVTIQGTSMATPFVAGIVALMLQREPRLTPEEVQQRLRITARRDATTGPVWNPRYGWGKLDAQALFRD